MLPLHSIKKCGNSSVGRAQPCQGWGREFESRLPLILIFVQAAVVRLVQHENFFSGQTW